MPVIIGRVGVIMFSGLSTLSSGYFVISFFVSTGCASIRSRSDSRESMSTIESSRTRAEVECRMQDLGVSPTADDIACSDSIGMDR